MMRIVGYHQHLSSNQEKLTLICETGEVVNDANRTEPSTEFYGTPEVKITGTE